MKSSPFQSLTKLTDKRAREALVDSHLRNGIAFQIRALRRRSEWTQEELAREAGMQPTQITRVENPSYGSHTIATLRRIAAAFDVALIVRFVPFSELLKWDEGQRLMAPAPFWGELSDAKLAREAARLTPLNVVDITAGRPLATGTSTSRYGIVGANQLTLPLAQASITSKPELTGSTRAAYA